MMNDYIALAAGMTPPPNAFAPSIHAWGADFAVAALEGELAETMEAPVLRHLINVVEQRDKGRSLSTQFDDTRAAPIYRAGSADDVAWIDDAAPPLAARCAVCGDPGPHRKLLVVPSLAPPYTALTLSRCAGCGSGFYDPPGITDFSDLNQDRDDFWRFYVEVGGGVWETIWPLFVDRAGGRRTLLDIGCGFGFAVDFWRRAMRADAVGVELADYGAVGARMLDIPVHRRNAAGLRARSPDAASTSSTHRK